MKVRLFHAFVAACIALPVQGFELWTFSAMLGGRRGISLAPEIVANLVLLALLCAVGADFSLAGRRARAALLGIGVALLIPGSMILDELVAFSSPDWDAGTWFMVLLTYLSLLGALSVAEAGLYLLATRPRVVR